MNNWIIAYKEIADIIKDIKQTFYIKKDKENSLKKSKNCNTILRTLNAV